MERNLRNAHQPAVEEKMSLAITSLCEGMDGHSFVIAR